LGLEPIADAVHGFGIEDFIVCAINQVKAQEQTNEQWSEESESLEEVIEYFVHKVFNGIFNLYITIPASVISLNRRDLRLDTPPSAVGLYVGIRINRTPTD